MYYFLKDEESDEEDEDSKFKVFSGTGYTLRSPAAKSGFGTSPKSPVTSGMKMGTPPAYNNKKKEESVFIGVCKGYLF